MKKQMKTTIFLAALIVVVSVGCSAPAAMPTETPLVVPSGADLAGGVYENAAYQFFHWKEGLNVMIWHDAMQSSTCSQDSASNQGASVVTCQSVSKGGQTFDWQIETLDGLTGTFEINNSQYVLSAGNVITISTAKDPVEVKQFQRDLSGVTVERESISGFSINDADLAAFIKYAGWKSYANSAFGLSFQYPGEWFGPDEYISDQQMRLEIGSDVVYPYGTDRTEQIYTLKNSYFVIFNYSKNDQVKVWDERYQSLLTMQDGESLSGIRDMIIRVRQITIGNFEGFEYIATLSETAQTEIGYQREVLLYDQQSNVLLITGVPNMVEVTDKSAWREAWSAVDEANQELFHQILDSITIE